MESIKNLIRENPPVSISDYFSLDKKIQAEKESREISSYRTIRIALLSSFTTKGIKEALMVKCAEAGILPEFYVAPYNQYANEIFNPQSNLYSFKPNLVFIFIDTMSLFGEQFFSLSQMNDHERKHLASDKALELHSLYETLSSHISGKVVLHNLEVPVYSSCGILENKQNFGLVEMIRSINQDIADQVKSESQVLIFDYELFCSKYGKLQLHDPKMYYLGDIKLSFEYIGYLADEYMGYIKPIMSLSKKCLVMDMDNTLWGGIIGEDGIEGIALGPTPSGRPFLEFQKYILNLFHRGVILALNSRNNPEAIYRVLNEHPYMVLKEEHFVSMKINWKDKATNLEEIAGEINIGLDSIVFIDDDKFNRELVREMLPQVYTVEMPEDPSLYVRALQEINDFNTMQLTEEDKQKGHMYIAQRKRQQLQNVSMNLEHFLKELHVKVTIKQADKFTISRISQLTQKTNQFNVTTRRYSEEDIKMFAADDKWLVFSAKVEDRFGDNGITGVVIINKNKDTWTIDSFLLSCRVLGRNVKKALMYKIIEYAKKDGVKNIKGIFVPTAKNKPAQGFFEECGFHRVKEHKGEFIFNFSVLKDKFYAPEHITIVEA